MDKITERLVDAGGKLWIKGSMDRVYLNAEAVKTFLELGEVSKFEEKSLNKAKTFFCIKGQVFRSDVGTVRVLFNQNNVNCVK